VRAATVIVGRSDQLGVRLASLSILGLAATAVLVVTDRASAWAIPIVGVAAGAIVGVLIGRWQWRARVRVVYWTGEYEGLSADERSTLERVDGKPMVVTVRPAAHLGGLIAGRIARFSAVTAATHFLLLPAVFLVAWLIETLWSDGRAIGPATWARAMLMVLIGAAAYVATVWWTMRTVPSGDRATGAGPPTTPAD